MDIGNNEVRETERHLRPGKSSKGCRCFLPLMLLNSSNSVRTKVNLNH